MTGEIKKFSGEVVEVEEGGEGHQTQRPVSGHVIRLFPLSTFTPVPDRFKLVGDEEIPEGGVFDHER